MDTAFTMMRNLMSTRHKINSTMKNLVLFMTDGFPNPLEHDPRLIAQAMKNESITIVGLGVTERVNQGIMRQIVSDPFEVYFEPFADYRQLARKLESVLTTVCERKIQGTYFKLDWCSKARKSILFSFNINFSMKANK